MTGRRLLSWIRARRLSELGHLSRREEERREKLSSGKEERGEEESREQRRGEVRRGEENRRDKTKEVEQRGKHDVRIAANKGRSRDISISGDNKGI